MAECSASKCFWTSAGRASCPPPLPGLWGEELYYIFFSFSFSYSFFLFFSFSLVNNERQAMHQYGQPFSRFMAHQDPPFRPKSFWLLKPEVFHVTLCDKFLFSMQAIWIPASAATRRYCFQSCARVFINKVRSQHSASDGAVLLLSWDTHRTLLEKRLAVLKSLYLNTVIFCHGSDR